MMILLSGSNPEIENHSIIFINVIFNKNWNDLYVYKCITPFRSLYMFMEGKMTQFFWFDHIRVLQKPYREIVESEHLK